MLWAIAPAANAAACNGKLQSCYKENKDKPLHDK